MDFPRITDVGDTAFNVEFGDGVDRSVNAQVVGLCRALGAARPVGLVEVVPTFRSALIVYDPLATSRASLEAKVRDLVTGCADAPSAVGRTWRIPVCFDADLGPDLDAVRLAAGLDRDQAIALFTGARYFVYMLGFMPGFGYLGEVPKPLRLPRRATPRVKVPAGSVAIAGAMGAVYPWESPGGWHLLGRTPVAFFDPARQPPALLAAGDDVVFEPIDRARYEGLCRQPPTLTAEDR